MSDWVRDLFGVSKPIIGMCHLRALPGDPQYDAQRGMSWVIEMARQDLLALQTGGVDAVMFSNEFSLPYLTQVEAITVASMAAVIASLKPELKIPFGVNVLWDAKASLDLALVVGASFVREIFTGVYASDFGLWDTNAGEVVRYRQRIGAGHVRLLFNIVPESAVYLGGRELASIARSTVFNNQPDGLCVSGLTAGAETPTSILKTVKDVAPQTPVFANTGVRLDNVANQLAIADGAVVGTALKVGGSTWNAVDEQRVRELMQVVRTVRTKA
jgi:uncharacterized protein